MKTQSWLAGTLAITISIFPSHLALSQMRSEVNPIIASSSSVSSLDTPEMSGRGIAEGMIRPVPVPAKPQRQKPFMGLAVGWHAGVNGAGFDIASPLAQKMNLKVGADFFSYSFAFQEQGADINAAFRLRSGHAALDWFPFGGRFRVSPLMVFANSNQVRATALIPAGSTLSLNGQEYISSYTDPLHGSGSVGFRKVSPGISIGFGNMIPRSRSRVSFPIEAGFYYVGQPTLKVNFLGSACDPQYPASVGCQPVMQDAGFQKDLAAFVVRNNHNLSYASFFPILSVGFSYSFGNRQGRIQ
ncbi:hypothetical protein [Edaphobacter flagellatus]|uniref:hypothetical protein n=1 Tax=Edaphobacter flagellatus TaxID=1933044 RepID=UPI0021B17069|nr:hypothetical protein [Edaphobacter flagellatus]